MIKSKEMENLDFMKNVKVNVMMKKDEYDLYINNMARIMCFMATLAQCILQSKDLINPIPNTNQIIVSYLYNVNSLSIFLLLAISFKTKQYANEVVFVALMLQNFKSSVFTYDFENVKPFIKEYEWQNKLIGGLVTSEISYVLQIIFFQKVKFSYVWFLIHMILNNYMFIYHTNEINFGYINISIMETIICGLIGNKIQKAVENMIQNINENKNFKTIFDNIDESIIILKSGSKDIEYVNNKFLIQF